MSESPFLAPSPLRRVLLRVLLFGAIAAVVCAGSLAVLSPREIRIGLLFGLGMAIPAALVGCIEVGLRTREPSPARALIALVLAWIAGCLGVSAALCQAAYLDAMLDGKELQAALEKGMEMLGQMRRELGFVLVIAVPFGPAVAARLGLRSFPRQAGWCLVASGLLGWLLARSLRGETDRTFALVLCLAGALVLPAFGALADRVERRLWPPEPEPEETAG